MAINGTERPRFFEGQYLGAQDLMLAVDYERAQRARHSLGAHTWGIAMGLQITERPIAGGTSIDMYIQPGYAWDGFGRPVVVLSPYRIPPDLFAPFRCAGAPDCAVEVWLQYVDSETGGPRPGFETCGGTDQFSRVQESFTLVVGARTPTQQRSPISVAGMSVDAEAVLQAFDPSAPTLPDSSVPYQSFPDDGTTAIWLVPLGYVRWKPDPNPTLPGSFIARTDDDKRNSLSFRRSVGVVAGAVGAVDGSIRLRRRENPYSSVVSDDLVWAEGSLRVEGDIKPFGGALYLRTSAGLAKASTG